MSEKQRRKDSEGDGNIDPQSLSHGATSSCQGIDDISAQLRSGLALGEVFGGGSGGNGGKPDKPRKDIEYIHDIEIDPENPQVEVEMNIDLWAQALASKSAQSMGGVDIKQDTLNTVVNGDVITLEPKIYYCRNFQFELGSWNNWEKSNPHYKVLEFMDDFKTNLRKQLVEQKIGSIYSISENKLSFSCQGKNDQEMQKELEDIKKAIAIALEVFLKMLKNTGHLEYKVSNPKVLQKEQGTHRRNPFTLPPSETDELKDKIKALEVTNTTMKLDDIGGNPDLKNEIAKLVKQYGSREYFEKRGVFPPKGILLHGPPGTGKTLAAKIFAGEIGRKFYHIKASDITSKWFGESEKVMKAIFEHVDGPCIIFIDEIDSIGGNREYSSEPSRRVLTELLQGLDGMGSRSDIILVAATNRKEDLDPALLRPSRFDRHILVDKPDTEARKQIFQIHIQKQIKNSQVPIFKENIDIDQLVKVTEGLVGADIEEIIRRAKEEVVYKSLELEENILVSTDICLQQIEKYKKERQKEEEQKQKRIGFGARGGE